MKQTEKPKHTLRQLAKLHTTLYRQADKVLKKYNPCKIEKGECSRDGRNFCCGGCKHLSEKGCTTEALWCKVWLCGHFGTVNDKLYRIREIASKYGLLYYRSSKFMTLTKVAITRGMRVNGKKIKSETMH